jgi:Flp pilus assembly CpaF family ATPase
MAEQAFRDSDDPTDLPLFTQVLSPRPGRVRSTFSMRNDAVASPDNVKAPASEAFLVRNPPQGWGRRHRAGHLGTAGMDWSLVARLRVQASERLSASLGEEPGHLDRDAQQELGRSIIVDLLQAEAQQYLSAGNGSWSMAEQDAVAKAVFDALFGLGRLQPLVDDDRIENIIITGHDTVRLELTDGTIIPGEPVADSDSELIEFLVFLASRSEVNARPFSPAQPRLHLRLDGGCRLAAAAWVTSRPSVVIRRHRLRRVSLDDLVELNALTPLAASFLSAAVRARKSMVVAGPQGAGKTTMVRALCAEIPPHEAIGTFETEYELHLHEMADQHPIVHAWEARPGSGERGADGRRAGEFSLDEALYDSFRFNLSRQIVGEVRGREVIAMIKAMESGAGSISTTHAGNGQAALRKLVTCAMEAGAHVTHEYATRAIAENIDLVVQLQLETTLEGGAARRDRWVSEILAVTPGEREKGYATTHVFSARAGRIAVAGVLPDDYRDLERHDFDLRGFYAESSEVAS